MVRACSADLRFEEPVLDPVFVLHKASTYGKSERKPTRMKMDSSSLGSADLNEYRCGDLHLRREAFEIIWSKIESTIKSILEDVNANAYSGILSWVRESFRTIRSFGLPRYSEATRPFPFRSDAAAKQLFTGLVLTKNIEFVDDLMTFQELAEYLKADGCHVANLSSMDFSTKDGIGICLRNLLRQFLTTTVDAADISTLSSWYHDQQNGTNPIVIIINDLERCSGSVLSDFIVMLSEWVVKIPIILVMGVATTPDVPRNILHSSALQCLFPCKFTLQTPAERMDAVVEAVLVRQCSGFFISHKVASFIRDYFTNQDGTLSAFIKALKMACAQHFMTVPSSYTLNGLAEEDIQDGKHGLSTDAMPKTRVDVQGGENLVLALSELKKINSRWSIVLLCLHEAGKLCKIRLLDLLCEVLDPELYTSEASDCQKQKNVDSGRFLSSKRRFISQAIQKVRSLPEPLLGDLLKSWEKHTVDINEVHEKVKSLWYVLKHESSKRGNEAEIPKRRAFRNHLNIDSVSRDVNKGAADFIESLVNEYLRPLECAPFHEIACFKNAESLQAALAGDPRRQVPVDLLDFRKVLCCSCCEKNGSIPLPSMPDTAIMHILSQEHGDLINLYDWYQSFKSILVQPISKGKHKKKQAKKKMDTDKAENLSEVTIQARFCRAVTELQISGILRMQSKRRPDFVHRVAFRL